jgi:uncharacterized membrane protein
MVVRIKSAGLIAALLMIWLPSFALAQEVNIGVSPAEVHVDNLPPGETAEFELTIHNKDEIAHNFTITAFAPPKEEIREGRAEFPDANWISFCPPQITVAAGSQANATVTVAIPQEQKWAGRDWEIWLGVTPESSDLLGVKLYVRLLVSTNGMRFNAGLVAGIAVAIVLLGYGSYHYFRRKAKPE